MTRAQKWLAWAALLASVGCGDDGGGDDKGTTGATCGAGTTEKDGVCVADGTGVGGGDNGGTSDGSNEGGGNNDGTNGTTDPTLACGAGTVEVEGECVPEPAAPLTFAGFTISELTIETQGKPLTGAADDPELSVDHPIDLTVTVRYDGSAATIPLIVGLGEAPASGTVGEGFCLLGGIEVKHTGVGEVTTQQRVFLSENCLADNTDAATTAIADDRVMSPVILVDPEDLLEDDGDLPSSIVFAESEQDLALEEIAALNEDVVGKFGDAKTPLKPSTRTLSQCKRTKAAPAGSCALKLKVKKSAGPDFQLAKLNLESSVAVLNKCFQDQAGLDAAATAQGLPTGYICNRSIVRGLDANGEPLPEGNVKDYTYGAPDIDVDTTVIAWGLPGSNVKSADELMPMGEMVTQNGKKGIKLNVKPEDIANNALGSSDAYTVRYFLRPASVPVPGANLVAGLKAAAAKSTVDEALNTLVEQGKLLPVYLHAQGEQAKADGESLGGQDKVGLEETVSIPQAPTEYSHGLYIENDCGRFNDPDNRPDSYRPGTPACDDTLNPRDEILYGDHAAEKEFTVVACLTAAPDTTLPASDDPNNNCLEQAIRVTRVVPRQQKITRTKPAPTAQDPFAKEVIGENDVSEAGFTQDELFGAADADGWAQNYAWDQGFGNDNISLNVHAHTYNSLGLVNGASTDNEAKLFLRSGTFDFTLDLVRLWAQAAARTIVVGSYYDYGLEFFGIKLIGERKEAEYHREWDWNQTKEWGKEKSIFVKVAWVDVGFKVTGQVGFKVNLDVIARDLSGDNCTDAECSPLKTAFGQEMETVGEAAVTLTPYGNLKGNVFAAISIQVARAGAAGEITVVDIGIPAKAALNWGFDGQLQNVQNGKLILAAWANINLNSSFLSGRIYLFAENRTVEWCSKKVAFVRVYWPCGFGWSQFWDYTIASWGGWQYNQLLWASPTYKGVLDRNGLTVTTIPSMTSWYKLQAVHSGKCLDAPANQNNLYQWDCHGQVQQRWQLRDGGGGTFYLVNQQSGKTPDVGNADPNNLANIQSAWPWVSVDNQRFTLEQRGDAYMLKFKHSGRCADVGYWSHDNGGNVLQYDCHGGANQLFRFVP
jgi:hypothetical protein